ncbi:hypothetical protein RPMA_19390 [Tardiphaga alba]|uniref:Conjugative transfer region protein TrbK n=1 Tax=Tardiphaga alba TaxID=340268 RepID=A0ABX8AEL3_9BRAD|nr:hypothetical protein [Tardiphaga alba]QUS40755.1 hypothetical protein RPMA_19390 [Tardiphaga alba]
MASNSVTLNKNVSKLASGMMAAAVMIGTVVTVHAQGGTDAQREACMPDAFRLCATAMPDERRVENCLRDASPRLSRACYDVFYPPQAATPNQVTRGQGPMVRDRTQPSAPQRPQNPSMPQMPPGPEPDDE